MWGLPAVTLAPCLFCLSLRRKGPRPREIIWFVWVYDAAGTQSQRLGLFTTHVCLLRSIQNKHHCCKGAIRSGYMICTGPVQNEKVGVLTKKLLWILRWLQKSVLGMGPSVTAQVTYPGNGPWIQLFHYLLDLDSWKAKAKKGSLNTENAPNLSVTWKSEWMSE